MCISHDYSCDFLISYLYNFQNVIDWAYGMSNVKRMLCKVGIIIVILKEHVFIKSGVKLVLVSLMFLVWFYFFVVSYLH
jgi:hypothetical protein